MSQIILTIEIIDYIPSNFDFTDLHFIFSSGSNDFTNIITYQSKNSISHKIYYIPKKNIRYHIKVTKNNYLIGISDFQIPSNILQNKTESFSTLCTINMTDSIRRVIFGNISPLNEIKINIKINLQYKKNNSNFISKKSEPKILKPMKTKTAKMNKIPSQNIFMKKIPPLRNAPKNRSLSRTGGTYKKMINTNKIIDNDTLNEKRLNTINAIINYDKDSLENSADSSIIDDDLKNKILPSSSELNDFIPNFVNNKKYENINNLDEMVQLTKNNLGELLNYQIKYYELIKNSYEKNQKYNKLLIDYNKKYRLTVKKLNEVNNEINKVEMKNNLKNNYLLKLLDNKKNELDLFKNIYSVEVNQEEIDEYANEKIIKNNQKKDQDNKTQMLLLKVLRNISANYGPLNNLLDETNSTEEERININNISQINSVFLNGS